MMKLKLFGVLSVVLLSGCTKQILDTMFGGDGSPGVLTEAGGVMQDSSNPTFIAAGFAITTLAAIVKAVRSDGNLKEVVSSVEDGFKELDDDQKAAVKKTISASMPAHVKKAVSKVRKHL